MKKVVKNQKLSDAELDIMLKKMLYKKLCLEPKPKNKKAKHARHFQSESESESDSTS